MNKSKLTTTQAAGILGIDAQTVARWCKNGLLQAQKGKHARWEINSQSVYAMRSKRQPLKTPAVPSGYIDTHSAGKIVNRAHSTVSNWARLQSNGFNDTNSVKLHGKWYIHIDAVRTLVGVIPESTQAALEENGRKSVAKISKREGAMPPKPVSPHTTAVIEKKRAELADSMKLVNRLREKQGMKAATL